MRNAECGVRSSVKPERQLQRLLRGVAGERSRVFHDRRSSGKILQCPVAKGITEDGANLLRFMRVARDEDERRHPVMESATPPAKRAYGWRAKPAVVA